MKRNKILMVILTLSLLVMSFAGCKNSQETASTTDEAQGSSYTYDGSLKITGLDEDFEVPYNDIYSMETVTEHMQCLTSDGELKESDVMGVKLDTILAQKGVSQKDFSIIRLIAGDGYSIDVPVDIVSAKDIVLAYEFDGQPLEDTQKPIRAAINDVRSMYWVSNLVEIDLQKDDGTSSSDETSESAASGQIVVLETACNSLETEDYTYYDSLDQAVKVTDLFTEYVKEPSDRVEFVAADGFTKSDTLDVLNQGYIKITGEDTPIFLSPDLPKGMHVKDIMFLTCGDTTFMSAAKVLESTESRDVKNKTGAALDKVIEAAGLTGDYYVFTSSDGYTVEVSKADLVKGIIYNDDGIYAIKFDESLPKSTNVKDVISISIGDGSNAVTATEDTAATTDTATTTDTAATDSWVITFDGLDDGSFDLAKEKAEQKFTLATIEATKKAKDGSEKVQTWEGYKLLDALSFLHVDGFSSLTVVANDGYETEITKDQVDDSMILGVSVDGQALTDSTNLVQIVSATQPSSTWVKGVAKITVNK